MKKHMTFATLAALLFAGANGHALAQATGGHSKNEFVETYDLNKDGKVTHDEFAAQRSQHFKTLDLNGDGKVDEAEYVGEYTARLHEEDTDRRERQIRQAHVRFGVLDTDKNAVLAAAEFEKSGTQMFARLDTNGDGAVDATDTKTSF
ncbi:hypothetical protein WSK_0092 [Novosphingobium sp. Rr 2-17]|uniref:EF-hand domain-containing protein n=1 Tax=Novosphingobium sp. Rr 2-17 TaxID=555793 RepID=UPI000269AADB|nr:hypothetical protein [Novosphingobium sp. Rr 2-17]EIZ81147.1 hypothetical protein WSK_0092 [Novosphingobium sp. Rr 2-17]